MTGAIPAYGLPLKVCRKGYRLLNPQPAINTHRNWMMFSDKAYANSLISKLLSDPSPCMIARFGSTEMQCLVNYLGVTGGTRSIKQYITQDAPAWWWEKTSISQMQTFSGFFSPSASQITKFCELMLQDIPQIDILASWLVDERRFAGELRNAKRVVLEDSEPFFAPNPWTKSLEGKKVLVVHPFAETIESQYKKRTLLFENGLLPEFSLKTVKAVQSLAGEKMPYRDWFEALDHMKAEIDGTDYDIAIIGAGAYGMPLAGHVKRAGKKAVHLGGVVQLLFGIVGRRWEDFLVWPYMNLFNEHWVRPGAGERPKNAQIVEGACYW